MNELGHHSCAGRDDLFVRSKYTLFLLEKMSDLLSTQSEKPTPQVLKVSSELLHSSNEKHRIWWYSNINAAYIHLLLQVTPACSTRGCRNQKISYERYAILYH